jgi:FkbM family methyltransferase
MVAARRSRIFETFSTEADFLSSLQGHIGSIVYEVERGDGDETYRLHMPGHHPFPTSPPRKKRAFSPRQREVYEPVTTAIVDFLISRFDVGVFYDLGARNGYFSMLALSAQQKPPVVHSFEMSPPHIAKMRSCAMHESYVNGRWHVHLAAIADRDEGVRPIWFSRTRLFEHEPAIGEYQETLFRRVKFLLRGVRNRDRVHKADVLLTSVDGFIEKNGRGPDALKVDIDGYEGKFIDGAIHLLTNQRPFMLLEVHRDELISPTGHDRASIFRRLFDLGYSAVLVTEHNDLTLNELQPLYADSPAIFAQDTHQILFY